MLLSVIFALYLSGEDHCMPYCPKYYRPVCGNDGITYGNIDCLNAKKTCPKYSFLQVKYVGPCKPYHQNIPEGDPCDR